MADGTDYAAAWLSEVRCGIWVGLVIALEDWKNSIVGKRHNYEGGITVLDANLN